MNLGDIYVISSPSGKCYIGQCVQYLSNGKKWGYQKRYKHHVRDAMVRTYRKKDCRFLNNAIRKYGPDKMTLEKIMTCNISELDELEAYHIEEYYTLAPNGYNLVVGGANSRQSEETKKRRSLSMIGKNRGRILNKRKRKFSEDNILPKYLCRLRGKYNGYCIQNHPTLKRKRFIDSSLTIEQKLKLAQIYLKSK